MLGVENEEHLRKVAARLEAREIPHVLVVEVDCPYEGQAMSIGLDLVVDRTAIRKAVSDLPLLR